MPVIAGMEAEFNVGGGRGRDRPEFWGDPAFLTTSPCDGPQLSAAHPTGGAVRFGWA
jgi:hypothetical protein